MNSRLVLVMTLLVPSLASSEDGLRERLKDANGVQTDVWVYNNIDQAREIARQQNKPLFVTFRCVPCKDCAAFDADVANGNERVKEMARDKFISVRQVEMKGVDLSLFQFDHDLNWAGMFINADGVVYARYGTQSAEGSDAYNSIDGLLTTMQRVLELHAGYPGNLAELKGKRGTRPVKSALELPGLRNPEKYARQTERSNCIHCHNIHDAEYQHALETGTYTREMLWKYPLPDNIGLKIDRKDGVRIQQVVADSAAARAGFQAGEDVVRMNGQRILSIADMQWVLHPLPNTDTQVEIETSRSGRKMVALKAGWKESDFSWRGSTWNAPPRFGVWAPRLPEEKRRALKLPEDSTPLEVRWINRGGLSGQKAFEAGLREQDVIVELAGKPIQLDPRALNVHLKLHYKVGDTLPLTVLRNGKQHSLKILLAE